ncbi:MAG TPA: hypothetical protein VM327_00105 [Candidatus Thermoplasmatota archaeon]|nr:hypothetical protein [Candidatus Thermoplasmatota archaeon]
MRWVPVVFASLLFLAGCFGGANDDGSDGAPMDGATDGGWAARALVNRGNDDKHDHSDPTQHEGMTTPNFEVLGFDPLSTEYYRRPAGGSYCGQVAETEGRDIAVYHSFTTNVALVVVDVTNRTDPQLIGELVMPLTHVYDASMTSDGRYALLATTPKTSQPDVPPTLLGPAAGTYREAPTFRDACGNSFAGPEENLPFTGGVVLVDLSDPTQPTIADYDAQPVLGVHSISAETIDGTTYVAGSTTNLVHGASYYTFYTLEQLPGVSRPHLQPFGTFTAQYPAPEAVDPAVAIEINGHVDATIQKHPITGQILAYLANWNGGLVTVELVAPGQVEAVGMWSDYDPAKGSEMSGQWHSVHPLKDLRNGRHLTLFGQEIGGRPSERPTSLALIMDTTDPSDIRPVARWTLPIDVQWDGGAMWSTHYLDMVNDTLFVTLYHAGVWAADASEANWPNLASIGAFVPNAAPPDLPVRLLFDYAPCVLDLAHLSDGTLVVIDGTSGVYTARFDPHDPRVPPVAPWTDDHWSPAS